MQQKMQDLKAMYSENKEYIVGIGETGIDLHYANTPEILDLQKKLFQLHADLAQELNLPIIIHSRDAWHETLDVLKTYKDLTIYFHCRGYGPDEITYLQNTFPKLYI
jgi:TatD DNase family protein